MKVNPYGNIPNVVRKPLEKQHAKADVAKKKDQVEISNYAKIMQQESKIAAERLEKIEALKEKVQNGEYKVNSQDVARKFYDFWNE